MGSFSLGHWLVVLAVVVIVFGAGRVPKAMGDLARGMRAFRSGMREEAADAPSDRLVEGPPADQNRGQDAGSETRTCSTVRRDA